MTSITPGVTYGYEDKVPADKRGYFHALAGAAIALVATFGVITSNEVAAISAVAIAAIDLILVLVHTRTSWRKAAYPFVYALGGVLILVGTFNELQVAAIVGLAIAVLGTQYAAAKTPVTVDGEVIHA